MKQMQIGVIGSMNDIKIKHLSVKLAKELGKEIAKQKHITLFALESDFESLPQIAAKEAAINGGQTMAFVCGSTKPDMEIFKALKIVTGQQRGGGREFSLILSCDAIIAISGRSGTLMEITIAYQAGIPVIALANSGGWSSKLSGKFLDGRKRQKIFAATSPKEAVAKAVKLGNKL